MGRLRARHSYRQVVEARSPTIVVIRGESGGGVSRFVRDALTGLPHRVVTLHPLTGEATRGIVLQTLRGGASADGSGSAPDWPTLLGLALERAPAPAENAGPPFTLVFDNAHLLLTMERGAVEAMIRFMVRLVPRGIPFHLTLAGSDPGGMLRLRDAIAQQPDAPLVELPLRPLTPGETGALLPRWSALERLRAWCIFGGNPARLAGLPPGRSAESTLRALVLDPGARSLGEAALRLERSFVTPFRYGSVLRAVALGARSWGDIAAGVKELEGSARLGPYVQALVEEGLLEVSASLDARPGSRSRRYALPDPFLQLWFGLLLPRLDRLHAPGGEAVWESEVSPRLAQHVEEWIPRAVRSWLEGSRPAGIGAPVREAGALWGEGIEIPVAGILESGAAVYGLCDWSGAPLDVGHLEALDGQLRRTRYGFARAARLRLLVGPGGVTPALRARMARDSLIRVVTPRELTGQE